VRIVAGAVLLPRVRHPKRACGIPFDAYFVKDKFFLSRRLEQALMTQAVRCLLASLALIETGITGSQVASSAIGRSGNRSHWQVSRDCIQCTRLGGGFLDMRRRHSAQVIRGLQAAQPS
jgi:hypothetical protein